MIPALRKAYNESFTVQKYNAYIQDINHAYPGQLDFRVAETPVFIPAWFKQQMLNTCESIVDFITAPQFKSLTNAAIPPQLKVPYENDHTHFIAFDFGICENANGEYEPQLIEMQGFPSLFAFQVLMPEMNRRHFFQPPGFDYFLNGFTKDSYIRLLKEIITGPYSPENVVLLEIFPEKQKTRIDFFCTREFTGIPIVCLTDLIIKDRELFYMHQGKKIKINRIYNRLIFDDLLQQQEALQKVARQTGKPANDRLLFEEFDVEWVPHPNWFYRISKYTLPFINHPNVPHTRFLNQVEILPADLENYVLKPLFSFAGQGVIIDVTRKNIEDIPDPANWILQQKVNYAPVIETPGEPAKAEIRIFYFWKDGEARPIATNNLARLSKGKMVGVRYNKNKNWVGGSFCWIEK